METARLQTMIVTEPGLTTFQLVEVSHGCLYSCYRSRVKFLSCDLYHDSNHNQGRRYTLVTLQILIDKSEGSQRVIVDSDLNTCARAVKDNSVGRDYNR